MNKSAIHTLEKLRAGQLAGATRLDLSCDLSTFPPEIFELADTLEVLNLSGNALKTLPDDLVKLSKLKVIFCSENQFEHVPEVLGQFEHLSMIGFKSNKIKTLSAKSLPKNLQWLILTDNQLTHLPVEIGQCAGMQKLMLAGNQLSHLPPELAACKQLELLRISANQLMLLPNWLLSMPKLAWLAFAGNPFSAENEAYRVKNAEITRIDWQRVHIQAQLGQGASGVIYQADYLQKNTKTPVAVKLFKGELTSDGLPQSEMAACMHAGLHPNLTQILGSIEHHPEKTQGLVLSLIDPSFKILANPPSLTSCTRDVYEKEAQFSLKNLLSIATGVARAAAHLHANGLMHGDLYAHNILHNTAGDCLLSDFGATAFLPNNNSALALQRLEVRAFACLLEELLAHCETKNTSECNALEALQRDCSQATVANRPLFAQIVQTLEAL
ncbi:MAG: leucine-rich repeat-containing protein kinase family protein [Methylophilaceae bacterium]